MDKIDFDVEHPHCKLFDFGEIIESGFSKENLRETDKMKTEMLKETADSMIKGE